MIVVLHFLFDFQGDARKGFIVATIFPLLNKTTAAYVFLTYGATIVQDTGTQLSPKGSSIGFAVMPLIGTFITTILVDTKGRKFLLVLSMVGCSLGHIALSIYLYLHGSDIDTLMFNWTPVICMGAIVLLSSAGIIPLTLICIVESFPVKVRSLGLAYGNLATNVFAFAVVKIFPVIQVNIGLLNSLLFFAAGSIFGSFYVIFCVEETKGKDLNVLKSEES